MTVEEVGDPTAVRTTVAQVLGALPAWFGIPESTREYIEGAATCPCLIAREEDRTLGFLSYRRTSDCAAEISVMGVVPGDHRRGVGQRLVDFCVSRLAAAGYEFLTVKTLADTHPSPEYARTRAFYLAQGFRPLEVLPDLWGPENPCLYLVKPLAAGPAAPPGIRSRGLELRTLAPYEVDDYHLLFSSPQVCEHWDRLPFTGRDEAQAFVDEGLASARDRRQFRYSVYRGGRFAGTVCFYGFFWHQRRATLGYALAEEFWGQGLMTAALVPTLEIARDLGLHRLQALVLPDHWASARVLEKAGFIREGTLRDYELWPGRGFVDLDLYAIVLEEKGGAR